MDLLITAFGGSNNSSKILIDKIAEEVLCDKLVFKNDREKSIIQLNRQLMKKQYEYIISFGQKPLIKNKIYIETTGRSPHKQYNTEFDYSSMQKLIQSKDYTVKISTNAGTSFCNHIYYYALDKISTEDIRTKMIFVHIPFIKNITDVDKMAQLFSEYINSIAGQCKVDYLGEGSDELQTG